MKLRNKKNGNKVRVEFLNNWQTDDGTEIGFRECNTNNVYSYNSLTDLIEDWEDYEEPKEFWYIEPNGVIARIDEWDCCTESDKKIMKQIGNHFETSEEAEKVVEKLKALKRLKDKGFEFLEWEWNIGTDEMVHVCTNLTNEDIRASQIILTKDLDLLFGEEK